MPFRNAVEWSAGDRSIWTQCRAGGLHPDAVRGAYFDNLQWVLDAVATLREHVGDATVVLTADHGNALGEWGTWGHAPRSPVPAVRRVPWVGIETGGGERPVDGPLTPAADAEAGVAEQLAALGYR